MARDDIGKMIAEVLGNHDEQPAERPPRRPLAHGEHILEQYVAMCETSEGEKPEPSARVELPVSPAERADSSAAPTPRPSFVKKALARVKR